MSEKTRVGLIGTGMIGKAMARRILGAGYHLTVHDIRPEPVKELVGEGASKAESPKEVAELSDVVLTSLPTLAACEEVYLGAAGLLKGARSGQTFVETSTVPPSLVRRFSDVARKQGVAVIDAALLTRTLFHPELSKLKADEAVSTGLVTVLVGANPDELERVRPVLATFGNPILHLGPVGSGEMVKVLNNAITHANFAVACEVYAVASKAGVDMRKMNDLMLKTGARSSVLENPIPHYLETGTGKMMGLEPALKDSESMLQLGREFGVPLPIQSIAHAYYEWARSCGLDRPWDEVLPKSWEGVIGKPLRF